MSRAATTDILDHVLTIQCRGLVETANDVILDFHYGLEALGHNTNLNGTVHGLTELGETIGLGRIGGDNFITDAVQAVPNILNHGCPVQEVANLVTDAGQIASAGGAFIKGISHDLSNPNLVYDVAGGLGLDLPDLGVIALPGCGLEAGDTVDALLGALIGSPGGDCGCPPHTGAQQEALIDIHTDGSAILQTHDTPEALLGLNGHGIL